MDKDLKDSASAAKRSYEPPTLVRRDSLGAVTAGKKKLSGDEAEIPVCWVARAVYGRDNPRWLLFRAWLLEDAPAWLRTTYLRHGPRFARMVARRPLLAATLRALMDRAIAAKFSHR